MRAAALALVTAPWLTRHLVPINKFSDNYVKIDPKSNNLIRLLYRLKKYQYVVLSILLTSGSSTKTSCSTV
jgi:hypothetical protein